MSSNPTPVPGTVVIIQPCFFPWRGQLDLISRAETVIFLDNVQFSRGGWFNRNRLATSTGPQWFTVPIRHSGHFGETIADIRIDVSKNWQKKMLRSFDQAYSKHPFYANYADALRSVIGGAGALLSPLAESRTTAATGPA